MENKKSKSDSYYSRKILNLAKHEKLATLKFGPYS